MHLERQSPFDFPTEVERRIFEIAFESEKKRDSYMNLLLVSHKTCEWLEGMLYRVIFFDGFQQDIFDGNDYDSEGPHPFPQHLWHWVIGRELSKLQLFLRTMQAKPASFFQRHVRTLVFETAYSSQERIVRHRLPQILGVCSGIVGLQLRNADFAGVTAVSELRLTSIATDISHFRHLARSDMYNDSPIRRTLTHFVDRSSTYSVPTARDIQNFSQLAHVAFSVQQLQVAEREDQIDPADVTRQIRRDILCLEQLKRVVVFADEEDVDRYGELLKFDGRVIVMKADGGFEEEREIRDSKRDGHFWARVERLIGERQ